MSVSGQTFSNSFKHVSNNSTNLTSKSSSPHKEEKENVRVIYIKKGVVPQTSMSDRAKEIISEIDDLEVKMADARDAIPPKLEELITELGCNTFEHPDRGFLTIMNKKGTWYWRPKPHGYGRKGKNGEGGESGEASGSGETGSPGEG